MFKECGWRTNDGGIPILKAHQWAFGSGELKTIYPLYTSYAEGINIAAHIPPAIAIRGMLKQFCRSKFANWRDRKKTRKIKEQVYSGCLYLVYKIDQSFAYVCIKFQLCRPHRKVWQNIECSGIWEEENWRNKGINKHQQPDSSTHDISTYCPCVNPVSTLCASQSLRKERWNIGMKNEEIKRRISRRNLVLFHIKQQMIHSICTKLQNSTCNSSWEIFVTNFPMYYTGVRDGKRRKKAK